MMEFIMAKKVYRNFNSLSRFLKQNLPINKQISVRRLKLKHFDGECEYKNNRFIIRIDSTLPEIHAIDVLVHEFSHAISWGVEEDYHGPKWGKAYSFVYRKYLEWLDS